VDWTTTTEFNLTVQIGNTKCYGHVFIVLAINLGTGKDKTSLLCFYFT